MLALLSLLALAADISPVEQVLVDELDRAMAILGERDEAPHYAAVAVLHADREIIAATQGTIAAHLSDTARTLDVDLRVGAPALDSTHPLRGFSALEGSSRRYAAVPFEDGSEAALRHEVWRLLDAQYRAGEQRIVMIRANRNVKVEEEELADDFEPREGLIDRQDVPELQLDTKAWEGLLVDLSKTLDSSPWVFNSAVTVQASRRLTTFVDTEGARLVHGALRARLSITVDTVAEDGDRISVFRTFDVHDPASLPSPDTLQGWAHEAVSHLEALRDAPRGQPYSGPVILTGRAAGVFFHEVFGHRVEGHRQKSETEGKTFADQVGERVLPSFIDIYDDPTVAQFADVDLNGHYAYDDEGVAASRAELVNDGVFVGFLMGRSPIPDFAHSNGHGRRMTGHAPVSRMGSTIIESSMKLSDAALRAKLIQQLKKQGLPHGYLIDDIDGGFTLTGRVTPNAFNVRASTSWRIYADGRPDELVRGIDLVGTPLVAFHNLIATSKTTGVFNGHCGAESGWVPVSAVSPAILFSRLEFQLKEKGQERPPLLSKPGQDGQVDAGEVH